MMTMLDKVNANTEITAVNPASSPVLAIAASTINTMTPALVVDCPIIVATQRAAGGSK